MMLIEDLDAFQSPVDNVCHYLYQRHTIFSQSAAKQEVIDLNC